MLMSPWWKIDQVPAIQKLTTQYFSACIKAKILSLEKHFEFRDLFNLSHNNLKKWRSSRTWTTLLEWIPGWTHSVYIYYFFLKKIRREHFAYVNPGDCNRGICFRNHPLSCKETGTGRGVLPGKKTEKGSGRLLVLIWSSAQTEGSLIEYEMENNLKMLVGTGRPWK